MAPKGGEGAKTSAKDQTERNSSLTCQREDKKGPLSFSSTLLYLPVSKGHSKPGRETVKALSVSLSCSGCHGLSGVRRRAFCVHVQSRALIKAAPKPGAATADSLTSTPSAALHLPLSGRWRAFGFDKDSQSLGVGVRLVGDTLACSLTTEGSQ